MNRSADWLRQAERDLQAAQTSASSGLHEWTAFASQQSAEKAVKALVESLQGSIRGHSITAILREAGIDAPQAIREAGQELDQVYVTARYPNGFAAGAPADYFSGQTSERLISHARAILEYCRSKIS